MIAAQTMTIISRCGMFFVLGLAALVWADSLYASVSARGIDPAGFSGGVLLVADASVWERYKRIRQGESEVADEQPTQTSPQEPDSARSPQPVQTPSAGERKRQMPAGERVPPAEHAGKDRRRKRPPDGPVVRAPREPSVRGAWWAFYSGTMAVGGRPSYGPYGIDFKWAYARRDSLPSNPRIVVSMHGAAAGERAVQVFAPSKLGDIEVRTQDAGTYKPNWREGWIAGANGTPYPGRRIAATLAFLRERYGIEPGGRGIVLEGAGMGGAGAVIQTMILPVPWRRLIAYTTGHAGPVLPRQILRERPGLTNLPPDDEDHRALWESIDFQVQSAADTIVRGMHYRHVFSSNDTESGGSNDDTQLAFVNLVERHRIGGTFVWERDGEAIFERGRRMPDVSRFEVPEQDVTLDRAHPAITSSTGNFPLRARDRIDKTKFPRGHYNLGILWNHPQIVDEASRIVFPLRYERHTDFGKGVPDQPREITISVTPRRPRHFALHDGETLKWRWDGGALSGEVVVRGDTVTVEGIPLVSGEGYKEFELYR